MTGEAAWSRILEARHAYDTAANWRVAAETAAYLARDTLRSAQIAATVEGAAVGYRAAAACFLYASRALEEAAARCDHPYDHAPAWEYRQEAERLESLAEALSPATDT